MKRSPAVPIERLRRRSGGPRAPVRALLDQHFDGRPGLTAEYPLSLCESNASRSWVFEADASGASLCVAHACWRPIELLCDGSARLAAGIGLVTTHAAWRGRGLASSLVEHCTVQAAREGCALALLFAPERSLYTRLGFSPAGRERRVELTHPVPRGPGPGRIRGARSADAPALAALLEQHAQRARRSAAEFTALLEIPETHTLLFERDGRPVAYCCEGKGRDLRGVIHEWAGEREPLRALVAELQRTRADVGWLLGPAGEPAPVPGREEVGTFCLARVLDRGALRGGDPAAALGAGARAGHWEPYVWGLDSF